MEKENFFDLQKWKLLKDQFKNFNEQDEAKIVTELLITIELFEKLSDEKIYEILTAEQKDFFVNNYLPKLIRDLLNHQQYQNKEAYKIVEQIIFKAITLIVQFIPKDSVQLSETFKQVFDLTRLFYKQNNQDENEKRSLGYEYIHDNSRLEWLKTLKQGDIIDAVKQEKHYRKACWSRAVVLYILENYNEVKLGFQCEYEKYDCYINMNSFEIAEKGTMSEDYDWRLELKVGDLLDVCDTTNVWYTSTVLQRKIRQGDRGDDIIEIKIGYRVYQGDSYVGWSERYDDWFTVTSPRISKPRSMAKQFCKKASQAGCEPTIDDSKDIIYSRLYIEKPFCALMRLYFPAIEIPTRSVSLINFINFFFQLKGFDKILQRIQDRENWIPFEVLANYLYTIGGLTPVFFRNFSLEFIPKLWDSVIAYLNQMPDSILRTVDQAKQDTIFKSFDGLLKRCFSVDQKCQLIENTYLKISLKCLQCDFLQQKILGLKMITSVTSSIRIGSFQYYTYSMFKFWLQDNKILQILFSSESHPQLIQRSTDILKFMIQQNMLTQDSLETIWKLIDPDMSNKEKNQSIYKVLHEVASSLQLFQVSHLLNLIKEATCVQSEHVDLINELFGQSQTTQKNASYLNSALQCLWNIFTGNDIGIPEGVKEKAQKQFILLAQNMNQSEDRYSFVTKCLENIKNNITVSHSIKIMKQLIESYPQRASDFQQETQGVIANKICREYNINNLILENIKLLKSYASLTLNSYDTKKNQDILAFKQKYIEKLEDRINIVKFINSLVNSQNSLLSFEFLSLLWEELVNSQIIIQESDLMFRWLKQFDKDFEKNINELDKFFTDKMLQSEVFRKSLTIGGFECFQSLFIIINVSKQKLVAKTLKKVSKFYDVSIEPMVGQVQNYQESDKDKEDNTFFSFECDVNPIDLQGINRVWDFAEQIEDDLVAFKALQFLIKLYLNYTQKMSSQIQDIMKQYLDQCLFKLKQLQNSSNITDKKILNKNYQRILTMIQMLQEESEVNGIGGLKSHSGLVKGEIQTLTLTSELYSIQEKKFELKINSNKTIFELKIEIAKKIKMSWDQIRLKRINQDDIKDSDNGKTVGDMRFKNNETLTIVSRQTAFIPQANLIDEQGNLLEKSKQIFTKWFVRNSMPNGLMDHDGCAKFISTCTNDICKGDDSRVKDVFQQMDHDNDGFLTLDNFLDFYQDACKNRLQTVWRNLQQNGYRNDLKDNDELASDDIDIQILPRFILMQNQDFYDILFELINQGQDEQMYKQIWQLLQNLPTSRKIKEMIVKLDGIKNQEIPDWSKIFDERFTNQMLYTLTIIEYLMEDEEEEEDQIKIQEEGIQIKKQNSQLLENFVIKKTNEWRSEFIFYGGFDQLFKVFQKYVKQDSLSLIEKQILQFILKVIKNYLTATLGSKVKHIYKAVNYARLTQYSLDVIDLNLKEDDDVNFLKDQDPSPVPATQEEPQDNNKEKGNNIFDKALFIYRQKQKLKESTDFIILSEKLQGELGNKIIQTLNIPQLLSEIINIILNILRSPTELELEDRLIIDFGLSILVAIVIQQDVNYLQIFLSNEKSSQLMIEGIFHSQTNVRKVFRNSAYMIVRQLQNTDMYIWIITLFIKNLPTSQFENRQECEQYYNLFCKVLEDSLNLEGVMLIDYEKVLLQIIEELRNHKSSEKRSSSKNDKILIGFLDLIERILKIKPQLCGQLNNFGKYIFDTCLFTLNTEKIFEDEFQYSQLDETLEFSPQNYVKCKQQQSRRTAYKILNLIFINNKQFVADFFDQCMYPLMKVIPMPVGWNYKPSTSSKSFLKFVGIKNLGATCYMNSILQQFYMTETFRYIMLSMDDKVEENIIPYNGKQKDELGTLVDDNILHQFQRMFAFLELSDRQFYNPYQFCHSYKDFDGLPVNVIIQQDAQEFLNRIFEKLESGLKNTPLKSITENIFGGKTSSLRQCNVCGNVKEKVELFYNLSLPVQNMKSIQETLDHMIRGEIINDFDCEVCKKKQDITNKICLSYLPNVLIIHLQRIVFDMDTFENKKINSHFEFPHILNLEPYTKEGLEARSKIQQKNFQAEQKESSEDQLEDELMQLQRKESLKIEQQQEDSHLYKQQPKEYYSYKLKGVVVHTGTAQQGHYYSYIQYKDKKNAEKWIEFNDTNIQIFDPKNIPKECFGGSQYQSNNDDWWASNREEHSKCAYVLVYERSNTDPIKFTFQNPSDKSLLLDLKVQKEKVLEENNELLSIDYFGIKKSMNKSLYTQVWLDNHKFMLEQQIYSEDFFKFILSFVSNLEMPSDYIRVIDVDTWILTPDIYHNYNLIDQQHQQLYIKALEFLYTMVFQIIAKANDNNVIKQIMYMIRYLLNLVPDYAFNYLYNHFLSQKSQTLEVLLSCPDKDVRIAYGLVINYCINTTMEINDIDLTESGEGEFVQQEYEICGFYRYCLSILNTEVAKNWSKMTQFFEMLRNFVFSGELQIAFAFKHEFIARLIDFYLQKESPLPESEYGKKIHQMTNSQYAQPNFNPLFQILSELIPRSHSLNGSPPTVQTDQKDFYLKKNEVSCLSQIIFYQKLLKESLDLNSITKIICHTSYQNLQFSREISRYLIEAFNRANCDEVKPYLQITNAFFMIQDGLFLQRAEWLMGVPTIKPNRHDNFNICGCLEDMCLTYESTLDNISYNQTILQMLYDMRKRYENYIMMSLSQFLWLLDNNQEALKYVCKVPPPNYLVYSYLDWLGEYINEYIADSKKYSQYNLSFSKEKLGEECLSLLLSVQLKSAQVEKKLYILGEICDKKVISNEVISEKDDKLVFIYQEEYYLNMLVSQPAYKYNRALPEDVIDKNYLKTYKIDHNSNIFKIIHNIERSSSNNYASNVINQKNSEQMDNKSEQISNTQSGLDNSKKLLVLNPIQMDIEQTRVPEDDQIKQIKLDENKRVDIENIFQAPFIRKIGINNETDQVIYINLQLKAENQSEDINFVYPISILTRTIQPNQNVVLWYINKKDVQQEWGVYQYNMELSFKSKELNYHVSQHQVDQAVESDPPKYENEFIGPVLPHNSEISEKDQSLQQDTDNSGQRNCPTCTFLNLVTSSSCTMCGQWF